MATPAPLPVEHRVFLAVTTTEEMLGVIVPRGLAPTEKDLVATVLTLTQVKPDKGRKPLWRQSPLLAEAWSMAEVHGRADWLVSLETLHRSAPVPFPRTTVLSFSEPA